MARIRTIKPEFFTSEDIVGMTPYARLLYIALWCESDKAGRFLWKPQTFKLRYMPGDEVDINSLCDEIVSTGLVVLYGDGLACIPSFAKHQHINPRESDSKLPEIDACPTRDDASILELHPQVGREGKGKITPRVKPKASASPPFDPLTELKARGVTDQTAKDWLTLRKSKRAVVTSTALAQIITESDKASLSLERALSICCKRGWAGFDAKWVKGDDAELNPDDKGYI